MNRKYKEKLQQQLEKCNELLSQAGLIANDFLTKGQSEMADSLRNKKTISNNESDEKKVEDEEGKEDEKEAKKNNYKEKLVLIADLLDFEVKFQSLTKVSFHL